MSEHPKTGTGHPEPLIGGNDITYSRSISKKDRLVYNVYETEISVLVISASGHYADR